MKFHRILNKTRINTFVTNDFGGTVTWEPAREGGTRVLLDIKLRAA